MGTDTHMAYVMMRRTAAMGLRSAQAPFRRQMATAMSKEESESMSRLYPLYRDSWFSKWDGTSNKGSDWKKTWIIVEAYPLFAAIGFGCGVCFLHCMRHLFFSPDVMVNKSSRANPMIENFKEGEKWKGNMFRSIGAAKENKEDPFRISSCAVVKLELKERNVCLVQLSPSL